MADLKKTLYHNELVKMGEVDAFVDSDPIESTYKRGTYFVALKIDNRDRTYTPALRECAEAFRGFKNKNVKIRATGSDYDGATDANIEILGGTTTRQSQPQQSNQRQNNQQRTQQPADTTKMPVHGQTVGMAVGRACDFLMSQGKELTSKNIFPIASEIIRISKYLEAGNLAPKASASAAKDTPPKPAEPPPQQRSPEPPQSDAPPETDDVPWN